MLQSVGLNGEVINSIDWFNESDSILSLVKVKINHCHALYIRDLKSLAKQYDQV